MRRFKGRLFAVGSSLAAIVMVMASQTPAQAATALHLRTGQGSGLGYATADGYVSWASASRGTVTASVTDWCPGDGIGAYLFTRAYRSDGTTATSVIMYDADGCSSSSAEPVTSHGIYGTDAPIDSVIVKLCYSDGWPANINDCVAGDSARFYNVY